MLSIIQGARLTNDDISAVTQASDPCLAFQLPTFGCKQDWGAAVTGTVLFRPLSRTLSDSSIGNTHRQYKVIENSQIE